MEGLDARLAAVRERIAAACRDAGREPDAARLIAVSKTHPAATVGEALAAGQRDFGENRVQEALEKIDAVGPGPDWHLIGHLQKNKARHVVGRFALIHGVDDARLAAELDRRAARAALVQPVLVQVRLGGEASKSGVDPAGLAELIDAIDACQSLTLRGLMTIPPPEEPRRWFSELRRLRDKEVARRGRPLDELSMGMSGDFEQAIAEGATLVRVGTAIFGERRLR